MIQTTRRQRIGARLFPSRHVEVPEVKNPEQWQDVIVADACTKHSLIDRIRILFSGRTWTRIKILTENKAGATKANGDTYPFPPNFLT